MKAFHNGFLLKGALPGQLQRAAETRQTGFAALKRREQSGHSLFLYFHYNRNKKEVNTLRKKCAPVIASAGGGCPAQT
jgi:hypothetical protein